jgi:Protein of unknown function (DUF1566)
MVSYNNIFRISGGILIILSIFFNPSCKEDKPTPPIITTSAVTEISYTIATSGGEVTYGGGATIVSRGVCWNTSANPTITDSKTNENGGPGSFTSNITQLTPNTMYYVRAYATSIAGTGYGNQVSFTTSQIATPAITTAEITSITSTTAVSGGNITTDNGGSVTARGVCWSTSQNPTINDSKSTDGTGTGIFTSSITGLTLGNTYYARAYATNSEGTAYGNEVSFISIVIGDDYQGGKVAYILQPGDPGYITGQTHGLIAAPRDLGEREWGCYGTTITGADGQVIGSGAQNTVDIVKVCTTVGIAADFFKIAAELCYGLVLDGYTDWYLPSRDELYKLYLNSAAIGGFADVWDRSRYWSSTEQDSIYAYYQDFYTGHRFSYDKTNTYHVRAVRSF